LRIFEIVRVLLPLARIVFSKRSNPNGSRIIDRFDQTIAVEDQTIAALERDFVLAERLAAFDAEGKAPRRQRFELARRGAVDVRIEMARGREAQLLGDRIQQAEEERHHHSLRSGADDDVVQHVEHRARRRVVVDLHQQRGFRHRHHDAAGEAVAGDVSECDADLTGRLLDGEVVAADRRRA
jgi:hypothetical protein